MAECRTTMPEYSRPEYDRPEDSRIRIQYDKKYNE